MAFKEGAPRSSRREFLIWAGKGGARTAGFVAINVAAALTQDVRTNGERTDHEQKSAEQRANGQSLEVKYFAKEIIATSTIISGQKTIEELASIIGGFFAGDTLLGFVFRNRSKWFNRHAGGVSLTGGKAIDLISTVIALGQTQDPRFYKYGFNFYFQEQNPLFSPNPSRAEILTKGALLLPLSYIMGAGLPFMGRGYLGTSMFIARSNLNSAYAVGVGFKVGDRIQGFIDEGRDEKFIRDYLEYIIQQNVSRPQVNKETEVSESYSSGGKNSSPALETGFSPLFSHLI